MKTNSPLLVLIAVVVLCLASRPPVAGAAEPGKTHQLTVPDQVPEGLAKSDWQSIRAAYEAGRHAFQPIEGGWQARNPGQQWTTKFDGRGFVAEPRDGGWQCDVAHFLDDNHRRLLIEDLINGHHAAHFH